MQDETTTSTPSTLNLAFKYVGSYVKSETLNWMCTKTVMSVTKRKNTEPCSTTV